MPETYFALIRREPSLVGYWRQNDPSGNNDMTDYASRFGLTGIYSGRSLGPTLIQADPSSASSMMTSGNGSATVSDVSPLEIIGDLSIESWIVPYTASETVNIASKQNSAATIAGPYSLKLVNGQIVFALGNGTTQTALAGGVPKVSSPTHVVVRCFRGTMSILLDGIQVASRSLGAQVVADSAQAFIVGKTTAQSGIDLVSEVAVYNGALSNRRVARHFTIGQQIISDPSHYSTVDPPVAS